MNRVTKIIIAFLLVFSISTVNIHHDAHAAGLAAGLGIANLAVSLAAVAEAEYNSDGWQAIRRYATDEFGVLGFMCTSSYFDQIEYNWRRFRNGTAVGEEPYFPNDATSETVFNDMQDFLVDNTTTTDVSVTFSDDMIDWLKFYHDDIIANASVYYGNTTDLTSMVNQFQDGAYYNGIKDYCIAHSDKIVLLDNGTKSVCCVDWQPNYAMLQNAYFDGAGQYAYRGYLYNMDTWQNITGSSMSDFMIWDSNSSEFVSASDQFYGFDWLYSILMQNNYLVGNIYKQMITYNKQVQFKCYKTLADLQNGSQGLQPFYYNNSTWQDFSNNQNTTYTIDNSNSNNTTYGQIGDYIADSYNNGGYPSVNTTNNWIEDNSTNIQNGGGGSSDDNGGGGSSSDGIFDFLSDLGAVLGNLISNLGTAITEIISGIADLITSIITELPLMFTDFLGALFGWLPAEWVALLGLGLVCMLIWGVVKIFRG